MGVPSWGLSVGEVGRRRHRRSNGTWYTLPTTYKTFGPKETNTINLRKGTYRVKVKAQHGHKGTKTTPVRIVR